MHCLQTQAAAQGNRLLALFTLQLEADEDVTSFPVIYTQGAVVNGQLQPHDVSRMCQTSISARDPVWKMLTTAACKTVGGMSRDTPQHRSPVWFDDYHVRLAAEQEWKHGGGGSDKLCR